MKKRLMKMLVVVTLMGSFSVPALACEEINHYAESASNDIVLRADIKYWVHDTMNGVKMHRMWNQTKGVYEGAWKVCDC